MGRQEVEAEILPLVSGLAHENIVNYEKWNLQVNRSDGSVEILLLMEFVQGISLFHLVERRWANTTRSFDRALKESEAKRVLHPVLQALLYLHRLVDPIMHLDLHPENIRICGMDPHNEPASPSSLRSSFIGARKSFFGRGVQVDERRGNPQPAVSEKVPEKALVKIIDFGCARKKSMLHTPRSQRERNLTFLAPEQLDGLVSEKTDIWFFGETLYYSLLGIPPFGDWTSCNSDTEENDFTENLRAGRFARPDDSVGLARGRRWIELSKSAQDLIERCLQAAPDRRIGSVTEVLEHPWWNEPDPPEPTDRAAAK